VKLLISPAKKMRVEVDFLPPKTHPTLLERSAQLLELLRAMTFPELKKLLACNDSLAQGAYENFRAMELTQGSTPALLAYQGIQYQYMAPGLFTEEQWKYVEENLRILSGFYGVLRPLDGVSPYRLEMQAKLRTAWGKNLYDFWGETLGELLLEEDSVFVNLASEEYAKAVRPQLRDRARFVTCVFGEETEPGKLVEKGVYVKMARGEMVRFAAETNAQSPEELRRFNRLGYEFAEELSGADTYIFRREKSPKSRKNF
jgi:cytoplasmic iron level regulating protein YaaA (DUF328/UPF0246 family)